MAILIGPFFYISGSLVYNARPISEGREQAGKPDNSYSHEQLYDDNFKSGDYINYPRGRVVWDQTKNRAIIYIDPCINREEIIGKIVAAFELPDYTIAFDDHYRCKNCVGDLFD